MKGQSAERLEVLSAKLSFLRHEASRRLLSAHEVCSYSENDCREYFADYQPITGGPDFSRLHSAAILLRSESEVYYGQVQQGRREGLGVAITAGGRVYEGQWKDGKRQGQANQIYERGNLYQGEFRQGRRHGKGEYFWFSVGSNSQLDLRLKPPSAHPQWYSGEWSCGLPFGQGEFLQSNGDFYRGQFKNGLKHGRGKQQYSNGDRYEGQFSNGYAQGYGEYYWADDSLYRGDFSHGQRTGHGQWRKSSDSKEGYRGSYQFDKKCGFGEYTWQNGARFQGSFWNDMIHGEGMLSEQGESSKVRFSFGRLVKQKGESLDKSKFSPRKTPTKARGKQNSSSTKKKQ